ncbi:MAG: hypothetical protein C6Y22_02755 [Hapalosiphonaceae cyanobacterium JJU2]|nr:MAG: hypothetical protein C6Y22_02755 [Hapalosiphonaceae cyanobacterium JJU2]
MYNVKGIYMKRNLTALMILLGVQLLLWKGIPIIFRTAHKETPKLEVSKVTNILRTTLKGHALKVTSAAITADHKTVISGSEDNTIKIWNLETGQLKRTLTGHTGIVNYLSVTPDDKYIVSAESKNVRIWNLQTGALIRELENSNGTISFVETSQDGKILIMDGGTQSIKSKKVDQSGYSYETFITKYVINVLNLQSGNLTTRLVNDDLFTEIEISSNRNLLVSGDRTGRLNIWNLRTNTLQKTLIEHKSEIKSIAISPDEKTIVSTGNDGQIKIWDVNSGKIKSTFTGHKVESYSYNIVTALIPDNNTLVTWNTNTRQNDVKIWNLQTGELRYTLQPPKQNLYLDSYFNFVKISPDGKNLITKGNNSIQTWGLATGQLNNTIKIPGDILAFSSDGTILATRVEENNINLQQIISK